MKFKHVLLTVFIFLLIGELVLRLDQTVTPFAKDEHIYLAVKVAETPELKMVEANEVPLDDSTFRVMVLGDSYVNGLGTDENKKFSNILRADLLKSVNSKYKRFLVLDVSKPGNNTLDNYNEYHQYYESFKPQEVILPYNINDVEDNLDPATAASAAKNNHEIKHIDQPNTAQKIYKVIANVHLVQFALRSFHAYLKSQGVVIPNSELDLQLKSYTQNKDNWVKSKAILNTMMQEVAAKNENMTVILMPEYNVINNLSAFKPTYNIVGDFFTGHPNVIFINPVKYFKNYPINELCISKYDGHPSILAHKVLADSVTAYLGATVLR